MGGVQHEFLLARHDPFDLAGHVVEHLGHPLQLGRPRPLVDAGLHVAPLDRLHRLAHPMQRLQHPGRDPVHQQRTRSDRGGRHRCQQRPVAQDQTARRPGVRHQHDGSDDIAVLEHRLHEHGILERPRQQRLRRVTAVARERKAQQRGDRGILGDVVV